jgi:hypothetical protein
MRPLSSKEENMDMHRAFHVAENLYHDEALQGIDYVGIGWDADRRGGEDTDGYFVDLYTDGDRVAPRHTIHNEKELEQFWADINQEFLGEVAPG